MNNNVNLLDKSKCTGCGLCYNVCPHNAISMKEDKEGFLSPNIDNLKCIDCGICCKYCPQMTSQDNFNHTLNCYAFIGSDDLRSKSSSGGAFGSIATWVIAQGGTVFGAAFTSNFRGVEHKAATDLEELQPLLKSKYLQSNTDLIFKKVKETLKSTDKPIVFCGCPCQVDALKRYIIHDYKNLITIDLFCHGVVSPMAYRKFIDEIFGDVDSPIVSVDFRNKKHGWACCNVDILAKDGTERHNKYTEEYFNAFLWGYSQRKACFNCIYAQSERVGDLSIGDFWGINEVFPSMNDGKGTSLVLCNTEKGDNVIQAMIERGNKITICDIERVKEISEKYNWAIIKPGIMPIHRDAFFYRLAKGATFSQAFRYASTGIYDVGIFGWWFEDEWTNYGSTLTYYALMEYVSSLGLSVCMIASPFHNRNNKSEFMRNHGYVISETYSFEEFYKHNKRINTFLLGSDQLWFYHCYKSWRYTLFFDFVADEKKKIAYATSFGHANPQIPSSDMPTVSKLLHRFDAISTREIEGVKTLATLFNIDARQNIDPVFLCDIQNWDAIADEVKHKPQGDFIFSYMLDPSDEKIHALKYVSEKLYYPIISITDKQYHKEAKEKLLIDCGIIQDSTIADLIYHIKNAKFIITDSYHGTCFALIFHKPFISIINKVRGTSRFDTLSELFDIRDRFVDSSMEIINNGKLLERPNYFVIASKIEREVQKSKAWLNNELFKPKK